jgi:hypothetical protein
MTNNDIELVKAFCETSKMLFNEKVEKYDFSESKSNIRLCNFGKSDTCRTASMWYAPKRYNDFGLRIEATTLNNLKRVAVNEFIINQYKSVESQETNKDNEYRFSFASLADMLQFFSKLQNNYRNFVASTKKEAEKTTAMKA